MKRQAVELKDIDFGKVAVMDGSRLDYKFFAHRLFYNKEEGIPLIFHNVYVDFTPKSDIPQRSHKGIDFIHGFISLKDSEMVAPFIEFVKGLESVLRVKLPLVTPYADLKARLDAEKPLSFGLTATKHDTTMTLKTEEGVMKKVSPKHFTAVKGRGDAVLCLNRIHTKDTALYLKFHLLHAVVTPKQTSMATVKNPFVDESACLEEYVPPTPQETEECDNVLD